MASERAADVLEYLSWWDYMLWREAQMLDPTVTWATDLSWDEWVAAGIAPEWQGYGAVPGEPVMNVELGIELYWPGEPPAERGAVADRRLALPGG